MHTHTHICSFQNITLHLDVLFTTPKVNHFLSVKIALGFSFAQMSGAVIFVDATVLMVDVVGVVVDQSFVYWALFRILWVIWIPVPAMYGRQ